MTHTYSWFIDVVNNSRVSGWCFCNEAPNNPALLSFLGDGIIIGTTKANHFRQDLKSLNFHPTGRCGFEFTIPENIELHQYHRFSVYAENASDPFEVFYTKDIPLVLREPLPKVFFMHIPKTAGTSFNNFANTLFPQESAVVHLEVVDKSLYPSLQSQKHYLAGHLPLREISAHFDLSKFDLYTIIREPYEHLHSHLKWVKRIGQNPDSGFFKRHSVETQDLALLLNMLDFSKTKNIRALVEGICGDLTTLFDNHQTRYFLDYKRKKVTSPDLPIALKELEKFKAIGVTERYQQFCDHFCQTYGINHTRQQKKYNRSESSILFDINDPAVRLILSPFIEFDLDLYQTVIRQLTE